MFKSPEILKILEFDKECPDCDETDTHYVSIDDNFDLLYI